MENDNGRQRFGIELDTAGLMQGADAARNAFRGISEEAVKSGATMDSAMSQASRTASREAGVIEASFKAAYREAGNMPLSEIKNSINQQITYIKGLELKYKDVSSTIQSLPFSPKRTALEGDLKSVRQELDAEKAALDGLKAKYAEMSEGSLVTFRTQIMNAKNELMAMRLAGEQNTEAYKELEKELGRLATIQREVNQSTLADSTGATQWNGIIQGLQGLMGAYSVGSGIVGMFTKDQEKLMQIQTKMQSVMGILMGMQTIANTLHSTSTFRLRTLTAATNLWHAANAKAAAGLRALGVSATVANVASKALMATMSMGLTVVIGLVVSGLSKLIDKHQETKRAAAESAKAQREAFEGFAKSAGEKASDTLSKFESLRQQYVRLGNDLKAREQFVKNNAAAFKELGVQVLDVHAADNLFINNTEAFKSAVMIRAQALAGEELAAEKYKEALQQRVAAEGMMWRASGDTARYAGLSDRQQKQAQEVYREAYAKYMEANYTSQLGGRNVIERGALTARRKEFEQEAQKAGNAAVKSYIDGLKKGLTDNAAGMEEAGNRLISASMNMSESAREQLRKSGIKEIEDEASKPASSDYTRFLKELAAEGAQAEVDAMREGTEKKLAQIDLEYEQREAKIREREAKLREIYGANIPAAMQADIAAMRSANTAKRADARHNALATPMDSSVEWLVKQFDAEEAAMNDYLEKYGTFRERIQAIKDKYDKKISEAETEGERMAAEAELAEILATYELRLSGFVEEITGKSTGKLVAMLDAAEEQLKAAEKARDGLASSSSPEARKYEQQINTTKAKIAALKEELNEAKEHAKDKDWAKAATLFQTIGSGARDAAEGIRGFDEGLADVLTTVANITSGVGAMISAITAIGTAASAAEKASAILAAISASIQLVSGLFSIFSGGETSMERNLRLFRELNDELVRLKRNSKLEDWEDTIFGTDGYGKAAEAMDVYVDAMGRYDETLEKIRTRGKERPAPFVRWAPKTWESAEESIANMLVQTRHSTWFRSAKYDTLKNRLPALFNDDGSLNMEALKEFQGDDMYKKLSEDNRKMIDDLIADWELYEKALDEVKDYLTDIFGDLGETMTDALVDAFANGTDAAKAFSESVSEMLEKLARDMIYSVTLAPLMEQAQNDMLETMQNADLTDEEKFRRYSSTLAQLTRDALAQQDDFNSLLAVYQKAAQDNGFDIFKAEGTREASQKGIATASQDTVDELNGRFTAIQGHTYDIREAVVAMAQRDSSIDLSGIKVNTDLLQTIDQNIAGVRDSMTMLVENNARTLEVLMGIETNTSRLANIETHAAYIHATLDDMAVKGIRIQ